MKQILEMICREYSITEDEFRSSFKYGSIPEARQLFCLVSKQAGFSNKVICESTGFSPPRVTILVKAGTKLYNTIPYFRQKCEKLYGILIVNK